MPDFVQRVLGAVGLILSAPIQLALAALVKLDSRGPVMYRAQRVGSGGTEFACLKLRTMTWRAGTTGPGVTVDADPRVTRVGRLLRRFRLDEMPQLLNVARGEMNLVGPRPEDPRFVDFADPLHQIVFRARPGITGLTQLAFADEAEMLSGATGDPDRFYRESILPRKVQLDAAYLQARTWRLDLWILSRTLLVLVGRRPSIEHVPLHR